MEDKLPGGMFINSQMMWARGSVLEVEARAGFTSKYLQLNTEKRTCSTTPSH
jgi:hypothetical protein